MFNKTPFLRHKNKNINLKSGFTIVELIVVIVIIGILAAISIVSYNGLIQRAKVVTILSDLDNASALLASDKAFKGAYPETKEAANSGDGLKPSPGITFDYHYINKIYCLEAYNGDSVYYHVNSENNIPAEGKCNAISFVANLSGICGQEDCIDIITTSIAQSDDGGYAITGYYIFPGSDYPSGSMYIAKYDKLGNLSWGKGWGSALASGSGGDRGNSIVQASDGGFVITGRTISYSSGGDSDMYITKFDSAGNLSWNKTWGRAGNDSGKSLSKTSDGGYVVTGETCEYRYTICVSFIAKYDSTGGLMWNMSGGGNSIVQTSDGGYAAIYGTDIKKYDSAGNLSWGKTWGGVGNSGSSLVQTSDGGYAVSGTTSVYGTSGGDDAILVRFDSNGNLSWSKTWGGAGDESGNSIVQTDDGGYIIVGTTATSIPSYHQSFFAVKFDSSGNLSWNKSYVAEYWYTSGESIVQTSDGGYAIAGNLLAGIGPVIIKLNSDGDINGCLPSICATPSGTTSSPTLTTSPATETVSNLTVVTANVATNDVVNLPATGILLIPLRF